MEHDHLFIDFNVGAARQISLSAEVRMHAEYNIKEKRKIRSVVDEKKELLKVKDEEIENLKAQLLLKEAEAAKAIRLRTEASKFEAIDKSLQDEITAVKSQSDNLAGRVHELETSSAVLQEKVIAYEDCMGEAISKAIEKGMQDGIAIGITHGQEGRVLTDVAAFNPSAESDYISALQELQDVNFSLLAELKSNKDASVETLINILRLEETLAKRLSLNESQPHVDQLMVPIYHSQDQTVIGATSLSALRDVFVPLVEPLSSVVFKGTYGTSGTDPDTTTTLSVTFAFVSSIPPISKDDYEVVHADGQEGIGADANPFSNVDDAKLNIQ
ncbi:hypothetical protein Tco_0430924 [Tanacetum coccineum]